jgi:hypothetical protein
LFSRYSTTALVVLVILIVTREGNSILGNLSYYGVIPMC